MSIHAAFIVCPVGGGFAATTRVESSGYGLPGGKLEPGESPASAALREAAEEGWRIFGLHPEPFHQAVVEGKWVVWFRAAAALPLASYKEQGRIAPVVATAGDLTTFGNALAIQRATTEW